MGPEEAGDGIGWFGFWIFLAVCLALVIAGIFLEPEPEARGQVQQHEIVIAGAGDEGPRQVWEGQE